VDEAASVDGAVGGAATRLVDAADRLGEARTGDDGSDLVPAEGGSDILAGQRIEHWKWLSGRLTGEVMGNDAASGWSSMQKWCGRLAQTVRTGGEGGGARGFRQMVRRLGAQDDDLAGVRLVASS
jgi:hypothetical protein